MRRVNDRAPFYIADKFGPYGDEGLAAQVPPVPSDAEIIEAMQISDL